MKRKLILLLAAVLLLLTAAGCNPPRRDDPNDVNTATDVIGAIDDENLDWLVLYIDYGENPIQITAAGCASFDGKIDVLNNTEITGGGIVYQMKTCAEWGDHYDGSYSICGEGSRDARYTLTPMGAQLIYPLRLSINYYDVILEASFMSADCVEIQYDSDITIKGLTGEFEIFVMAGHEGPWYLGLPQTRITGEVTVASDVTLKYSQNEYIVTATTEIKDLEANGLDGSSVITTVAAPRPVDACTIESSHGYYVMTIE